MSKETKQEMNELCGHSFGALPAGKSKPDPLLQQPEGICSPSANSRLRLQASCLQKLLPRSSVHQSSSVWTFWTREKRHQLWRPWIGLPQGPKIRQRKQSASRNVGEGHDATTSWAGLEVALIPSSACLPLTKMAPFWLIEGSPPNTPWQASRSRRGAGTTLQEPLVFRSRVVSLHNANTAQSQPLHPV